MLLRSTHTTTYLYSDPVSICNTEVRLTPRDGRPAFGEPYLLLDEEAVLE